MSSAPEVKTILIPVDGSGHARKAVLVGAAIAAKFHARVILLHMLLRGTPLSRIYELAEIHSIPADGLEKLKPVAAPVYDFGFTVPVGSIGPVPTTELLIEVGRRILEAEKKTVEGEGVEKVDLMMEDADPAGKIIEVAKSENADFIVLGHRGLGALSELVAGSVSTKVGHLAPATVITVK
jgi:nucleotide-binding universal stress UspA family protein